MNTVTKQWERVSSSIPNNVTQFKVTRLEEGQRYMFRVIAENDQGSGAPLVTEIETLAKNPFGKQFSRHFLVKSRGTLSNF